MRALVDRWLCKPFIARFIVRIGLKCHNFSYQLVGRFSQIIESENLHPKHRLTDYHQWFIEQLKPDWLVLDVGCGNGALTSDLSRYCKHVIGIDMSDKNIREAKKRAGGEYICADVTRYPLKGEFDATVLSNVLEHIEDRVAFLKKLSLYSERLLIRVPMVDRDWITLYKKELGIEYRLDSAHFIEYTFEGFLEELNRAGFKVESYRVRYGELYAVAKKLI